MVDQKTVVFGLDGACLDLIQPWLDDGSLPTLNQLISQGGVSELESTTPATTPPAWTSLTTGVNPGKHGIFGFYRRQRSSYEIEPVTDSDVHSRRLWDYTTEQGLTSLIINVPVTHPGRETNGAIIPGYLANDIPETYPENILDEIGMADYSVYSPSEGESSGDGNLIEEWLELTMSRAELASRLMQAYDWDLLFLEFQKTDGAMHKFESKSKVKDIFTCVDECIGDILSRMSSSPNVFVVSDHGIGQEKAWSVALNTWLRDQGYIKSTQGEVNADEWIAEAKGSSKQDSNAVEGVVSELQRTGITVQDVERVLAKIGLYDLAKKLAPSGVSSALSDEVINYGQSTAFYQGMGFSGVDVGIIINTDKFYTNGAVPEDEYEATRTELVNALDSMDGPAGPPFKNVRVREDVYEGPKTELAPDIILEQSENHVIGSQYLRGKVYIPTEGHRIDHTRNGMLIAAGPDIHTNWSLECRPSVLDITPTLVHFLGGALNKELDGKVLQPLLRETRSEKWKQYDEYQPVRNTEMSQKEEEDLRDRLEGMGYLG